MSLHATSYFAGVGTVVATMALGFGGGIMLTDAFVGKSERAPTLIERRAVAQPQTPPPVVAAAPAPQSAGQPATPEQQQSQASAAPMQAATPTIQEQPRFEQSFARASDLDLKARDAEARKAAEAERRKQERRKWAARRRQEMQKIDELTAVSEKVKQAEREREHQPVVRSLAVGSPIFSVFGDSDD